VHRDSQKQAAREYNNYLNNKEENTNPNPKQSSSSQQRPPSVKRTRQAEPDEDDQELGEEQEKHRVIPRFLKDLPGVSSGDSMGYRIEALRVYVENLLGDNAFLTIYKTLVVSFNLI
jgi:hypothetical protein